MEECHEEHDIRDPFRVKAFPDLSMCGIDASLMMTPTGTFDYDLAKIVTGNEEFADQLKSQTTAPTIKMKSKCGDESEVLHEFDDNSGGTLTPGQSADLLSKMKPGAMPYFCRSLDGCESEWCTPIHAPMPHEKPKPDECPSPNLIQMWQN